MSEIKGQLLGIVLVLGLFVTVSAVITAIVTGLTNKAKESAQQVGVTIEEKNTDIQPKLLHY